MIFNKEDVDFVNKLKKNEFEKTVNTVVEYEKKFSDEEKDLFLHFMCEGARIALTVKREQNASF